MRRLKWTFVTSLSVIVLMLALGQQTTLAIFRPFGGGSSAWYYSLRVCLDGIQVEVASNQGALTRTVEIREVSGGAFTNLVVQSTIQAQPLSAPETIEVDGTGTVVINYYGVQTYAYSQSSGITQYALMQPGSTTATIATASLENIECFQGGFNPSDDRINLDPWESAAVYCQDEQVKIYGIRSDSTGFFSFSVPVSKITALGTPSVNTLLGSGPSAFGEDIKLYLLTSGELEIAAPGLPPETWKTYTFVWSGC